MEEIFKIFAVTSNLNTPRWALIGYHEIVRNSDWSGGGLFFCWTSQNGGIKFESNLNNILNKNDSS
jgi:hypothetical protein